MGLGALSLYGTHLFPLLLWVEFMVCCDRGFELDGAMVGTGIENTALKLLLHRPSETPSYNAGYQADVTRSATGGRDHEHRGNGPPSLPSIQAALTGQVAATAGAAASRE